MENNFDIDARWTQPDGNLDIVAFCEHLERQRRHAPTIKDEFEDESLPQKRARWERNQRLLESAVNILEVVFNDSERAIFGDPDLNVRRDIDNALANINSALESIADGINTMNRAENAS